MVFGVSAWLLFLARSKVIALRGLYVMVEPTVSILYTTPLSSDELSKS